MNFVNTGKEIRSFVCRKCGNCCRQPGFVRIGQDEIERMASCLGMALDDFIDAYTRLMKDASGLRLGEHPDGSCILLASSGECLVHEAKPVQCCGFPFVWNYAGSENFCKGMGCEDECG